MVAHLRACCHSAILLGAFYPVCWRLGWLGLGPEFPGLDLVDITPDPRLTRFNRTNQRMLHFLKVLGRMLVLRRVAAAYMSAGEAQAQVHPGVSHFYALLADVRFGYLDFDLIEVRASVVHMCVSRKYSFPVK
jgi:hypothetical protein